MSQENGGKEAFNRQIPIEEDISIEKEKDSEYSDEEDPT